MIFHKFKNNISLYQAISKYKGIELSLNYNKLSSFELVFRLDSKCDHAGLHFSISLFGLSLDLDIQDSRHWNYSLARRYKEGEERGRRM